MQQTLEGRRQSLTEQLMKEQQEFNMDLKKRLDLFLDNYNKDKHFDYILSYKADGSSPVMYANKQFDITAEVTAGINAAVKTDKKQP
jgi:outer membrane protein